MNKRKSDFFKLLKAENDYKASHVFSSALKVSNKTILNLVVSLNREMKQYDLFIDKKPRLGLKLIGKDSDVLRFEQSLSEQNEMLIVNYSPAFRQIKILGDLLVKDKVESLNDIGERFSISETAVKKDIRKIGKVFKSYDVRLSSNDGFITLIGTEDNIQKGFHKFLLSTLESEFNTECDYRNERFTAFISTIFETHQSEEVLGLILSTNQDLGIFYTTSLFLSVLILWSRVSLGYHISHQENKLFEKLNYYESYIVADQFAHSLGGFSEDDILALSERLFVHRVEPNVCLESPDSELIEIIVGLINKMSTLLGIDLSSDEHLLRSLSCHVPAMMIRLNSDYYVKNPLLEEIRKQYLVLFSLVWYCFSSLEEKYDILLNDDEISLLLVHFQVAIEKQVIQKNVVIVCDNGVATTELMLGRVRQILPKTDNVTTLTRRELAQFDLSNIDFIISSVKLPVMEIPVILVSPLILDKDVAAILAHVSTYTKGNEEISEENVLLDVEFNSYFKDELLFVNKEFNSKEEVIDFLSQQFESLNLVTPNFKALLYEREALGQTYLETGVAIPHAWPGSVFETRISVLTLKEKIKWSEGCLVDVVVLLGISQSQLKQVKTLITQVLNMVTDPTQVYQLGQCKTTRELKSLLRQLI